MDYWVKNNLRAGSGRAGGQRADGACGHGNDLHIGLAVVERRRQCQQLWRLPQRQQGRFGDGHRLYRFRPDRRHDLQLHRDRGRSDGRGKPTLGRRIGDDQIVLHLYRHHGQQLRARAGRARARQWRHCLRERLEPEHGARQPLLHEHAGTTAAGYYIVGNCP